MLAGHDENAEMRQVRLFVRQYSTAVPQIFLAFRLGGFVVQILLARGAMLALPQQISAFRDPAVKLVTVKEII